MVSQQPSVLMEGVSSTTYHAFYFPPSSRRDEGDNDLVSKAAKPFQKAIDFILGGIALEPGQIWSFF